jgi:hypothetical protein
VSPRERTVAGEARSGLPNLIVIGAGKCGTSSLYHYLRVHPEISMAAMKELKFFVREQNWERGVDWYRSWFADMSTPVRGEASPQYTKYPALRGVPERMHSVAPDAKLIYLVRDPLERLVSSYVDRYARGLENRRLSDAVTLAPGDPYTSPGRYYMQLEQYLPYYPLERILVVAQDDLMHRRRASLREIFRFLRVDDSFDSPRFDRMNNPSNTKRRVRGRLRWLPSDPAPAPWGRLPWKLRARAKRIAYLPLTRPVERPALESDLRDALVEHFAPDAERLRALTGKALDGWSV